MKQLDLEIHHWWCSRMLGEGFEVLAEFLWTAAEL